MMSDTRPRVSSGEGGASVNVEEMTYRGDVPMSPAVLDVCQSQDSRPHRAAATTPHVMTLLLAEASP